MCNTSLNPFVVNSAVFSPFCSSIAFVATVVPCIKNEISSFSIPISAVICLIPFNTAKEGLSGVEGTLVIYDLRVFYSIKDTSVKVHTVYIQILYIQIIHLTYNLLIILIYINNIV